MGASAKLRLGDREVTRVGLGTNRLTPDHAAFLEAAVGAGVEHIDTAYIYTGGASEQAIGAAATDGAVVATKVGMGEGNGRPEVIREQVEESLRRLRLDVIELLYFHKPDPQTPFEESVGALAELREEGKIRHVGLSQVVVEQVERARAIVPVAAVQDHYNLAHREHDDVVDYCEANGIVFVPFFPLRDFGGKPVDEVAERHGVTAAQVALAWLLQRSPVMLPIPGTLSVEHLRQNLAALELELEGDEIAALR